VQNSFKLNRVDYLTSYITKAPANTERQLNHF